MDRTTRILILMSLVIALVWAVPFVFARQATVTTKQGTTLTGELVSEDTKQVVLKISGIRTPIAQKNIESIEYIKTPEEEYAERRKELDDDDFEGRYQLAYDMFEAKALLVSLQALESLKTDFPDQSRVDTLMEVVKLRIQLMEEERKDRPRTTPPPKRTPKRAPASTDADAEQASEYLNEEQVNLIRLWELPENLAEAQPKIIIPRDTLNELFEKYQSDNRVPKGKKKQQAFRGAPGWQQLQLIFDIRARDLYSQVIIREDPQPLRDFRRIINPAYVARYFRQHFGAGQIDNLLVFGKRPNSTEEAYTNFYILSSAQHDGRAFIDRDVPGESLLLQWGLPREEAQYPAPDVPGWRPFFRGIDDPRFDTYVQWVDSLYDKPKYGIQYQPAPGTAPGTAPGAGASE